MLSAAEKGDDLRQGTEQDLAAKAVSMVEGQTAVDMVLVEGKEYYIAYAPIPSMKWSYGTLIEKDVVVQPAQAAKDHLLTQAENFFAAFSKYFRDNLLRTAVLLLLLLLMLYYASRKAADRFVQPLLTLTAGVRDIASGNLEKKLSLKTGDEIEQLAESFNQMTDELRRYIKKLEQAAAEKERIATELSVAARIQAGSLPQDFPSQEGCELFATMQPAKEVGGDFYDFYVLDDKRLLVTIADVSDKGVPAALFMVRSKTVLGSSILRTEKEGGSLADAVMIANDELCQNNEAEQFVTAFAAVIDMVTGQVSYVNAGHNPPVILHKQEGSGAARLLPRADNPMLGVMEGLVYKENTLQLAPGDTMLLYTDGVTEAMNKEGQMFTKEQLLRTLNAGQGKKAEEIVSICMEAVGKHAAGAEASDDITMLCFHWQGI